jgi:transposase
LKASRSRITNAVGASGTTLTDLYGVGPVVAAITIGYSGDVRRFPTAGHYAAYNGTAPIELSSAGRTVHRLSRRGNRTLNAGRDRPRLSESIRWSTAPRHFRAICARQ